MKINKIITKLFFIDDLWGVGVIKLFSFFTEAPAKFKKECFPGKPFQPSPIFVGKTGGLYYKHMTIVNDDSSVIGK
jgi:hypothetical protein